MTEGLGLNHFADGLPYAPTHSKKKSSSFEYPPPRAPRQNAPSAGTVAPSAMVGTDRARQMVVDFDTEAAVADSLAEPAAAGCFRRVAAYGLDIVVSSLMFAGIVWASFALNGYRLEEIVADKRGAQQIFWPLVLLYVVVHLGYFLIQETTWRRTIGKAMLGIRIRSTSGFAALGRAVCFFIAALPLGIGLLWYFFDSRRRCWHDVISDSEVVMN